MRAVSARATVVRVSAIAGVAASLLACIIETEPGPKRPLLRDTLRTEPAAPIGSAPAPPPVPDAFRACDVDADCVAILPNGCCHDGRNLALNKALVDAYRSTFACPTKSPVCPMHLVLDTRTAGCDAERHLCRLVEPSP